MHRAVARRRRRAVVTAAGERGSALVPAVGVLSVLSVLSIMALASGGADLTLSTRFSRSRAAQYAAESALSSALVELSAVGGPIPAATFAAPWPRPELPVRRWQDGEWACSRSVALIPDLRDRDRDPATPVVLFDRSFGFADSPRQRGGYPLVQVLVTAASGASRQAIVAEIAPVTCAPRIEAAWTAAGPLALSGDIGVRGSPPALVARGAVTLAAGAAVESDVAVRADLDLADDLPGILNPGGTLARVDDLPEPDPGSPLCGIVWSRGDYVASLDGEGILVVHNPLFDPVKHEASRRAIEEGALADGLDPGYSHLDPARQPARLQLAGGSFRGLVVADALGDCTGATLLTGAVVTLSRSPQQVKGYAPLRIVLSRETVGQTGRGPLRHITAFRPLPASAGRATP